MVLVFVFLAISSVFVSGASAQDDVHGQIKELEQKIEDLKQQVEQKEVTEEKHESPISFSGYGELHYNHPNGPGSETERKMDFHRMVLGWEYEFKPGLSLHTEVDFEHAAKDMELEFAYVEKKLKENVSLRFGALLMPVGPLNETHEPPMFPSVERPYTQKLVIPTSWQEGGLGLVYENQMVNLRGYLVSGLDGSKFRKEDGIRQGRGGLDEQKADDVGFALRVEYKPVLGLTLGSSYYQTGASQGDTELAGVAVSLWNADIQYEKKGWELTSALAQVDVSHADKIQTKTCAAGACSDPGSKITGFYSTLSYRFDTGGETSLVPFIQYEKIDTHASVPSNVVKDPAQDRKITTLGLNYYFTDNVVTKFDVENWKSGDGKTRTQWNAGIGYMF